MRLIESLKRKKFILFNIFFMLYIGINLIGGERGLISYFDKKRIYEELDIFCQPVALNSGSIWPKNGKLKTNKTLTISVLDPISPGMNSDEFLNKLQKNIYEEIEKII